MAHYTATVKEDRSLELPQAIRKLLQPGQRVEIDLADPPQTGNPMPSSGMLKTLEEIAMRQQSQPESDNSETLEFIREARAGGMYGYEPSE